MRPRTLLALVVVGVIAIAGGWYFGTAEKPGGQQTYSAGKLMFPDLAPRLQDAARIEITHQDKTTAHRADTAIPGAWRIAAAIRCRGPSCAAC